MKVLEFKAELCTGCGLCEEECAETWFKQKDRSKSAIRITEDPAQPGQFAALYCRQLGDCIDVCPTLALARAKNGVVRIDEETCVGCLACVGFCPVSAMFYHTDHLVPIKCVACGKCVKVCPTDALSIAEVEDAGRSETERWVDRTAKEVSA